MSIKKSKYFFEEGIVETIGEVSDGKYEPLPNNDDLKIISKTYVIKPVQNLWMSCKNRPGRAR